VGAARRAAGDAPRALALLASAAEEEHAHAPDALYELGFAELERGELAAATRALDALLTRYPTHALAPEARFLRGECAFRAGELEPAAQDFAAAAGEARGELRARALFRSGRVLLELGRAREADAALAELARAFPEFANRAEGELLRGRALLALGDRRAARAALERVLALDAGDLAAGARLALGRVHEAEGRLDDALSEYLKVALLCAHEASVSEALLAAGAVLEAQGHPEQAAARYRALVEGHRASPSAARAAERLSALERGAR
jgi:TolA-binding protein